MDTIKENLKNKERRKPVKSLTGILVVGVILFSLGACQSGSDGSNEDDPNVLADRELVRDQGFDRATDGPDNQLAPENVGSFELWDTDGDDRWDREEFERIVNDSPFLEKWDTDNDGAYSEEELNEGIFSFYDKDQDGQLNEEEFITFTEIWKGEATFEFQDWDINNDYLLDPDEFDYSIYDAGIYDEEEENENVIDSKP